MSFFTLRQTLSCTALTEQPAPWINHHPWLSLNVSPEMINHPHKGRIQFSGSVSSGCPLFRIPVCIADLKASMA